MTNTFTDKLNHLFESATDRVFSYNVQRSRSEMRDVFQNEFETLAKKYIADLEPIYNSGKEELIRKHLAKIEQEIVDELKSREEFKNYNPPPLISRLRVITGGYEVYGDKLTK
jgi:hypothetical protein